MPPRLASTDAGARLDRAVDEEDADVEEGARMDDQRCFIEGGAEARGIVVTIAVAVLSVPLLRVLIP